ncbi:hypothetical protein C0J52_21053 [Blattella germanica]|nr:hypothetical protein C0J52_21053 [Blattella germanica]
MPSSMVLEVENPRLWLLNVWSTGSWMPLKKDNLPLFACVILARLSTVCHMTY